ncbi:SusD-like starch-binding protein associating with outer membrane [Sphingobacterium allocomposti]|uniref:SusD-like starch-binding protein associating with outer membrane n=1 Tax=Sphingobacterium allocomposti TaxID=415956 RepID=A0A5S5DRK6_9SPHI|nr:RagB/SusD family nutrient uptake outer membrane protein [Sphingobacterium composti Yoo et al. 2007 non Ten et al. 2007]TYP98395.1 SusD-like starch-binding protein associating with outer membrane [Sphingobacterium composti Yoo et al. 2007 non Ten et al. 2007]
MKKIIIPLIACLLTSCEKFLDSESYDKKNTGNFPVTVADANAMLTGIYASLNIAVSNIQHSHFYMAELAADDRFGGGGENDRDMQGLDHFMNTQPDRFLPFWTARFQGIFRANTALETLHQVDGWADESQHNQVLGEVHFLRALYYFELSQMFGEVPLVTSTDVSNIPKSAAEETYAVIAEDLKTAIELMPAAPYSSVASGHATKWAAQALLARVFLFYTGYYNKPDLPLASGGSITKTAVVEWLEECIANSGHDLVDDFRNLWPYANEFTKKDYKYAQDNNLRYAGDGNKETVFAVKFGTLVDWGDQYILGYSNQLNLHFGLRSNNGQAGTFPFGQGWGAGPVNTTLWNEWRLAEPNDIRRTGSIINVETDVENYIYGADNQMEETGLWQKKYIAITAYQDSALIPSYAILADAAPAEYQLAHTQDMVLIRFADVLLMHAELTETNTNLNRVRARANLSPVPYSLTALKRERRWELAFEGLRYFDLMRWHDAPEALARQEGVSIKNKGIDTQMRAFGGGYRARYEETGGFWPIPTSQIALSDGVLTQNKGWGGAAQEFPGW